jgi:hypothetical protein
MLLLTMVVLVLPASHASAGFIQCLREKLFNRSTPQEAFATPPPSDFFLNISKDTRTLLKKGSKIAVKTPETTLPQLRLKKGRVKISRGGLRREEFIDTEFYLNDEKDRALLRYGMERKGREVGVVSFLDKEGNPIHTSSYFLGDKDCITISEFDKSFLTIEAARASTEAFLIDGSHTHPSYEFTYEDSLHDKIRQGTRYPLTSDDIKVAYVYSKIFPHSYFRLRAITPNGYNYSVTLLDGVIVDDPLYSVSEAGKKTIAFYRDHKKTNENIPDISNVTEDIE